MKVSWVPSSFQDHSVARSGTMVSRLFRSLCWSYMTRLLKTAMYGITVEEVASSWMEPEGGVPRW